MHEERTEALRNEVIALFQQGQVEGVVQKITDAGEMADDDFDLQSLLGAAYSRLGRGEDAVEAFRRALGLRPNDIKAFYNLGAQLAAVGRPAEAKPLLEQVLREDPNHAGAKALYPQVGGSVPNQEPEPVPQPVPQAQPRPQPGAPLTPGINTGAPTRQPGAPAASVGSEPRFREPREQVFEVKQSPVGPILSLIAFIGLIAGIYFGYTYWQKQNAPETSLRKFVQAMKDQNEAGVKELIYIDENQLGGMTDVDTAKTQAAKVMLFVAKNQPIDLEFEVLSSEVNGNSATVKIKTKASATNGLNERTFIMSKAEGPWKVDMVETTKQLRGSMPGTPRL